MLPLKVRLWLEGFLANRRRNTALGDHTQFAEFSIFVEHARPKRGGIVVEVGLFGKEHSNSYDLMAQFGWRGILIEANPGVYETIERDFAGLDFVLQRCAISDQEGTVTLYQGVHPGVSSLIQSSTQFWGPVYSTEQVPARRLAGVLRDSNVPDDFDLLSLDIEGLDIAVLNDLIVNSGYRPHWILIEHTGKLTPSSMTELNLHRDVQARYRIVAKTYANLLLSRTEQGATQ